MQLLVEIHKKSYISVLSLNIKTRKVIWVKPEKRLKMSAFQLCELPRLIRNIPSNIFTIITRNN